MEELKKFLADMQERLANRQHQKVTSGNVTLTAYREGAEDELQNVISDLQERIHALELAEEPPTK